MRRFLFWAAFDTFVVTLAVVGYACDKITRREVTT